MMDNHILVKEMIGNFTNQSSKESFTFSCFNDNRIVAHAADDSIEDYRHRHDQHEHELFFDMDIALPSCTWEGGSHYPQNHHFLDTYDNMSVMGSSCYMVPDTQEFEFSLTISNDGLSSNGIMGALSPADDLFYKGQILPLHLPPRLRMVERLSSLDSNASDEENINGNTNNGGHIPSVRELMNEEKYTCSYQGSYTAEEDGNRRQRPSSTTIASQSSSGSWLDARGVQNANVFPDCYKDPALQLFQQSVVNCTAVPPLKGCSRPSHVGWRVLLPGSRRLSCTQRLEILEESFPGCDLRKSKEAQKWGFSTLKLRASGSFFKSLFTSGELGRLLVHSKVHHKQGKEQEKEEEEEDDDDDEDEGNLPSYTNCTEFSYGIHKENQTVANSQAHAERDKILKKARDYLHKYVRLFKAMYVSLSHSHHEQSRNYLLECSSWDGISTCSSGSSSSSKTRQGNVAIESKLSKKGIDMEFSMRTTSSSKRPKRDRDTMQGVMVDCINHSTRLHDEGAGSNRAPRDLNHGTSFVEVENPIQGAIAHCKQSSAISS